MKKRYWLKGGVIGFLTPIIFIPLGYSPVGFVTGLLLTPVVFITKMIFGSSILEENTVDGTVVSNSIASVFRLAAVFSPIFWFFIGAILGWFYGKIKNRNSKSIS